MLKYGLGIRSLYALFNKMRNAISDGLGNLAQYSTPVNSAISSIMSSLTQLKNSFATAFAPILTAVAPILTTFINLISRAVTYVGMFIAALTGQGTFTKAVAVQEDYAASLDGTADSAKKAKKAVEGYLSPLDEINKFSPKNNDSDSSSLPGYKAPSPGEMFETVTIENSIKGMADKIRKLIKSEDWEGLGSYIADGLNKGMEKIKKVISWSNVGPTVTYFVNAFTRTFNSLVDKFDWDLLGRTIGEGINTVVNTLNLLIDGVNWQNLGSKFAVGINGIFESVDWGNLGNLIGNKFMIAWNWFLGFVTNLKFDEIGQAIGNGINGAIERIDGETIGSSISLFVAGILEMIKNAIQTVDWTSVGVEIANMLRSIDWLGIADGLFDIGLQLISGLLQAFGQLPLPVQIAATAIAGFLAAIKGFEIFSSSNPVVLAISAIIAVGVLLYKNWDKIKEAAGKLKDWLIDKFNSMKTSVTNSVSALASSVEKFWNTNIKGSFTKFDKFLSGVFSHDWTKEFGVLGDVLNGFSASLSDIWNNSIKKIFSGIINFISGVFTGDWKKAWNGIKDIFKGVFSGLTSIAKTPINAIIGAFNSVLRVVNGVINKINSIRFRITVPDWVPGIGGSWWGFDGFNIPSVGTIPYLAKGTVVPPNNEFLAVLGDNKREPEVVSPLSTMKKAVMEAISEYGGTGRNSNITVQVVLNNKVVGEAVLGYGKIQQMATGENPFLLGNA